MLRGMKKWWDGEFIQPTDEERALGVYPGHVEHPWARRAWNNLTRFWLENWLALSGLAVALLGLLLGGG